MKLSGYLASAVIALATSAAVQAQNLAVSDVRVTADLTAVSSPEAAAYWGNLEADLGAAIAAQFVGQTAPDGMVILIDVDELALANFFSAGAGVDDARLTGDVGLYNPTSEKLERAFTVSASSNEAASYFPADMDVITISPTSDEFYDAVVRAFAAGVADTLRTPQ